MGGRWGGMKGKKETKERGEGEERGERERGNRRQEVVRWE